VLDDGTTYTADSDCLTVIGGPLEVGMTVKYTKTGDLGVVKVLGREVDIENQSGVMVMWYLCNIRLVDTPAITETKVKVGLRREVEEPQDWRLCASCGGDNRVPFLLYSENRWEEPVTAYGHKLGCRVGKPGTPVGDSPIVIEQDGGTL
jgi:hypothetical protein